MTEAATSGRPATLRDVAERAGVAASTVSRALSDPNRVNSATRIRIEKAAEDLRYVPSAQAKALVSGKTRTVALLVPDITNPFYFDIIRGTQNQLKAAGYAQLLVDTEESADIELDYLTRLSRSSDGVILTATRLSDEQLSTAAGSLPVVTINRTVDDIASVLIDTPDGAAQALQHLASLGHRRIGYIAGPTTSWSNEQRWSAIDRVAGSLGVSLTRIGPFAPKKTSGAVAADAAVNAEVSGCIVFNDLIAIGMLQRLAAREISVPAQMSIVGCDDIFGADFCSPALTTLTAPIEQAGRVATGMLLDQLREPYTTAARRRTVLPTHLTIRSSTGPAPRRDPSARTHSRS